MDFLKRLVMALSTAGIMMFFSEFLFVNEEPVFALAESLSTNPVAALLGMFGFLLWYLGPAYLFLTAVSRFRVRNIWAIFLAGAVYGFAVEGIVVWQMYEALPFSISWTPLGWHAIVDVLLGWVLTRRILLQDRYGKTAVFAILLGLFWGVWATWYWSEQPLLPPGSFTAVALAISSLWVMANIALDKWGGDTFIPSKIETGLLIVWTIGLFAIQIMLVLPLAALVLPPLMALTFFALRHNRRIEPRPDILATLQGPVRWGNFALLFLTPAAAAAAYATMAHLHIRLPLTNLIAVPLMMGGFLLLAISLFKLFIRQQAKPVNDTKMSPSQP